MKLGILGAGNIARKMAATVNEMEHVEAHAVASRDLQKAREFAQKWNVRKAYGSYEEMPRRPPRLIWCTSALPIPCILST